jgi:hypothetical protein
MKFKELIRKSYFLLEQDQTDTADSAGSTGQMKDAAKVLDKSGEQMASQVEAAQEQLVNLIKSLVEALMTEYRAESIKLTPSIAEALQNIKNSTLIPEPIEALSGIEEVITKMSSDYKKPDMGI